MRVVPGDPDNSYLIQKLEGRPGIVGLRMPLSADRSSPMARSGHQALDRARRPERLSEPRAARHDPLDPAYMLIRSTARGGARRRPQRVAVGARRRKTARRRRTPDDDPDRDINVAQPDFTLITLPTTLRVPRFKSAFRVTHRFTRPLGQGDIGDLAEDLFGLDCGALIGLEYRFGLMRGLQAGIHRTSDKTIEFFTEYNVCSRASRARSAWASSRRSTAPTTSATAIRRRSASCVSRELGRHGAVYFEPMWVNNSNPLPSS